MHRELKLVILVFMLVVGPAVGLSFLAGRILGNWNVILQKRMETTASGALEGLTAAWTSRFDDLRKTIVNGLATQSPVAASANGALSNAWFKGVYLFHAGQGLSYPADQTATVFLAAGEDTGSHPERALPPRGVELASVTNPVVAIGECLKTLQQPGVTPGMASQTGLRLARAYRRAGRADDARKALCQVACFESPGSVSGETQPLQSVTDRAEWPRDADEGFYYDLVALKILAESCRESGDRNGAWVIDLELLRRVVNRYDALVPLQRESMRAYLAQSGLWTGIAERALPPQMRPVLARLAAQWRERERESTISQASRLQIEQEFERAWRAGLIPANGWLRVAVGSNEFIVTSISTKSVERNEPILGVKIDRRVLLAALAESAFVAGREAGLGIRCESENDAGPVAGAMNQGTSAANESPVLAERRMANPLDWVTLVASPADPQAFRANMRLQARLYGWGGLVLVVSVVIGGWLIWREAAGEIRRARERSEFAAAVSHDLRTPLSSMRMLAESLYLGRIEEEGKRKRFLEIILKESDRLSRLTDRALYFIQYGQGALRYRMTEGDIAALVRDVTETFATGMEAQLRYTQKHSGQAGGEPAAPTGQTAAEHESFALDAAGGLPSGSNEKWVIDLTTDADLPPVCFDAGAMEQVFFNLLDNAVKYSRTRKRIVIQVQSESGGRRVAVAVRDFGVGIGPGELKQVFKAYHRGRGSANTVGLGLGLALCRDVVKAHRGRIEVESRIDQGSLFRVILPGV